MRELRDEAELRGGRGHMKARVMNRKASLAVVESTKDIHSSVDKHNSKATLFNSSVFF